MLRILAAAAVFGGLSLLLAFLYKANHNTPLPEGCEPFESTCRNCEAADQCVIKKL